MKPLWEQLKAYGEGEMYPFHMPGHKRRGSLFEPSFSMDITEVDGFDDLHHPRGILRESQARAAALAGARESFFSVNGSTAGLLAAITAATSFGDEILLMRGCHRSVYNAVTLRGLRPHYLTPRLIEPFGISGGVTPASAEAALAAHPNVRAVVITSPTYEGVVSDVAALADVVHRYDIPLIVDEAHGAHFLLKGGPASATACGADVVVQSLHKTLPALTGTALLHRMTDRIPADALRDAMAAYQTSSPSYLLMASIDACLRFMQEGGADRMERYRVALRRLRADISALPGITLLDRDAALAADGFDFDEGKLVLSALGMSGAALAACLREDYRIETEMALPRYVLAMTTLCDDEEGFSRLRRALTELSAALPPEKTAVAVALAPPLPSQVHTPYEASRRPMRQVPLGDSVGCVAAGTVIPYPPGIPLIVAGERISREAAAYMQCKELTLYGVSPDGTIAVEADE